MCASVRRATPALAIRLVVRLHAQMETAVHGLECVAPGTCSQNTAILLRAWFLG